MIADTQRPLITRTQVIALVLAALAIRLAYIFIVTTFGGDFDNGSDSGKYLQLASNINKFGSYVSWDLGVFGRETGRMPLYPFFLASVLDIVGEQRLWAVAVVQAFIDVTTVFAIGLLAGGIDRRWAFPAAILACGWTSLFILTSFVLADTLFMALFCWGLCACVWATRTAHPWRLVLLAGLAFSLALMTRPTLMFFPWFLVPALAFLLWARGNQSWRRALLLALVPAVMMIATLTPRTIENYAQFGTPVVTTQSGNHALDVVDQFIRLCDRCVAAEMEAEMKAQLKARMRAESREDQENPIILDGHRRDLAVEYLKQVPVGVMIKGTILGAIRSTFQSGVYEIAHQFRLDPQFLSAAPGETLTVRFTNFVKAIPSNGFLLTWAVAQTVTLIGVLLQMAGMFHGLRARDARPYILFLLGVGAYFLALNGPFGNPRYGIPLTPVLVVFTAAGLVGLLAQYIGNRASAQS
jgi:4-amino-4-deoxy-L-arabinose transferase-like glycosyltransferase